MDKKLEKYINYIVDDLVKNTEIDYDERRIYFPFSPMSFLFYHLPLLFSSSSFSTYNQQKYGAKEEETKIIWDLYEERILSLIKN